MKPIAIGSTEIMISDYLIDEAVQFLNQQISTKNWHNTFKPESDYLAILLTPYNHFTIVMDKVVEMFKAEGWDCKWGNAYDGRGPHQCFYVAKNQIAI